MRRNPVFIGLMALALSLSGCLTVPPQTQAMWAFDIEMALRTPPDRLRTMADGGDEQAMVAYAVVLRYGLNGAPRDPALADSYVARATQPSGSHTTYVWIPKTKDGVGGYTMPLTTHSYVYNPARAFAIADCAALLAPQDDPPGLETALQKGGCGGYDSYRRLKALWHGHSTSAQTRDGGRL